MTVNTGIEEAVDIPPGTTPEFDIPYPLPNSFVRRIQLENLAKKVEEALIQAIAGNVTPEQKAVIDQLKAPGPSDLFWTFGNGTDKVFTFTHNLNSRRYVTDIWLNAGTYEAHMPDIRKPTPNTLVVDFGTYTPGTNEYCVCLVPLTVIHGPGEDNLTAEMVGNAISTALTTYDAAVNQKLTDAQNLLNQIKNSAFTTTQRDALSAEMKWVGRVIFNTTLKYGEQWTGARWNPLGGDQFQKYSYLTTSF